MSRASLSAALATGAALLAAGCGDDGDNGAATSTSTPAEQAATQPATTTPARKKTPRANPVGVELKIVKSQFGDVVADHRGEALYLFDKEKSAKADCYGDCAKAWPPMLTKGAPRGTEGAKQGLLGTTKRSDGKLQVTYKGHPLYYYVSDEPGRILCQDVTEFGGRWLVVQPSGDPVT